MQKGPGGGRRRGELTVTALCFLAIVFDGYDLIVYGATIPTLLHYRPWGLTPATAGAIGSYALVGMLAGALVAGTLTDLVGRRRVMVACVAWFSLAMVGCALAPDATTFGVFRLLAGLGLGGVMPTATAVNAEWAAPRRRSLNNALMFSGYSVGGMLAAVLALGLMPRYGFRIMYWIGGAGLVLVVPLLVRWLPESPAFLLARGRVDEARRIFARQGVDPAEVPDGGRPRREGALRRRTGLAVLFDPRHLVAAQLFAVATFFGLLLIYGLNTWLPQIMRSAGYPLSSSLLFLLVMNLGAVGGSVLVAPIGDRAGMKPVTALTFLAAAAAIFLLSLPASAPVMYLLVAVAGFGTLGTQIMVNAYVAMHFPPAVRATALGWTLGIGRIGAILAPTFGGLLLSSHLSTAWNFYAFAIPAAVGAGLALLLPAQGGAGVAHLDDAVAVA